MREDFGSALRTRREQLGLSLRSVASAVGISPSMLSQVETGKLYPSVSTLYQIATFLDVSLDGLLGLIPEESEARGEVRRSPVQRAEDNPRIEIEQGVTWERLAAESSSGLEPLLATYGPGASSSPDGRLSRHPGLEHGYLLEGQLILCIEFDRRLIRAGDSFCFRASRPHSFVNETAKPAKGLWFTAPEVGDGEGWPGAARSGAGAAADTIRALRDSV